MLSLFTLLPAALAGPLDARISGVGPATAVHLLARTGRDLSVFDCNDAGQAPDTAADGVWTCEPGELDADVATVGLMVDGKLVDAGEAQWSGRARLLSVDRSDGVTQLSTTARLGVPGPDVPPAGPGQTLIVEVHGFVGEGAPVVHLATPAAKRQLNCGDDGTFPDSKRNDGLLGCAGVLPGPVASLELFPAGGDPVAFGEVAFGDEPVVEVTVDVAEVTLKVGATGLLQAALMPIESPGPSSDAGSGGEGPDGNAGDDASNAPPEPLSPKEREGGAAAGEQASLSMVAPSHPLADPGVVALGVVAVAIGAGVVVGRRRRPGGALDALRRVPSRPLFEGGPSISDGGCQLRTPDPDALAVALAPKLATTRRLLVASAQPLDLPPIDGASVWSATRPHIDDLVGAARALAARHGPELAVLMVGQDAALAPGDVGTDVVQELERRLPVGAFLCHIVTRDDPEAAWIARYAVKGPPWERETGEG